MTDTETLIDELLAVHQEEHGDDAAYDRWVIVEQGDWISEGKYENRAAVYKHQETGRFFEVRDSRSGSYYSDYYWNDPEAVEVIAQQVTVTQYVVKQ